MRAMSGWVSVYYYFWIFEKFSTKLFTLFKCSCRYLTTVSFRKFKRAFGIPFLYFHLINVWGVTKSLEPLVYAGHQETWLKTMRVNNFFLKRRGGRDFCREIGILIKFDLYKRMLRKKTNKICQIEVSQTRKFPQNTQIAADYFHHYKHYSPFISGVSNLGPMNH